MPNQYTKAKELGLPAPRMSEKTRAKLSEAMKKNNPSHNPDVRDKISKTCLEKARKGEWHTSLAKKMHYTYKGVDFDGSWEVAYAQFLDSKNIVWERCRRRFAYLFEDKWRYYTPDFYLPVSAEFVEIKGYETDKDRAKWSQFPGLLKVLKQQDLLDLGIEIKV